MWQSTWVILSNTTRLVANTQTFVLNCTDWGRTFSLKMLDYASCNFLHSQSSPFITWIFSSWRMKKKNCFDNQHICMKMLILIAFDSCIVRVYFDVKISNFGNDSLNMMMIKHVSDDPTRKNLRYEGWWSGVLFLLTK